MNQSLDIQMVYEDDRKIEDIVQHYEDFCQESGRKWFREQLKKSRRLLPCKQYKS